MTVAPPSGRRTGRCPSSKSNRHYRRFVSWDLDEAEAIELAREYLAGMPPPGDDEWVVTRVQEREWGWVVSWVNKRAAEGSRDTSDLYAGGARF